MKVALCMHLVVSASRSAHQGRCQHFTKFSLQLAAAADTREHRTRQIAPLASSPLRSTVFSMRFSTISAMVVWKFLGAGPFRVLPPSKPVEDLPLGLVGEGAHLQGVRLFLHLLEASCNASFHSPRSGSSF